ARSRTSESEKADVAPTRRRAELAHERSRAHRDRAEMLVVGCYLSGALVERGSEIAFIGQHTQGDEERGTLIIAAGGCSFCDEEQVRFVLSKAIRLGEEPCSGNRLADIGMQRRLLQRLVRQPFHGQPSLFVVGDAAKRLKKCVRTSAVGQAPQGLEHRNGTAPGLKTPTVSSSERGVDLVTHHPMDLPAELASGPPLTPVALGIRSCLR